MLRTEKPIMSTALNQNTKLNSEHQLPEVLGSELSHESFQQAPISKRWAAYAIDLAIVTAGCYGALALGLLVYVISGSNPEASQAGSNSGLETLILLLLGLLGTLGIYHLYFIGMP